MKNLTHRIQRHSFAILSSVAIAMWHSSASASDLTGLFKEIKHPHPPCEAPLDLSVGEDYFVPIANDLAGAQDYNRLTGLVADRDWSTLEGAMDKFLQTHESSPLREAVTYMSIYSKLERAKEIDSIEFREAEKALVEAQLLYPKSNFIPVISASIAAKHLKEGLYEKSLGLYKAARENYPFNELTCVFQEGVAESNWHLHQFAPARASFEQLLQKCKNPRLRLGAEIRIGQIDHKMVGRGPDKLFEKAFSDSPRVVQKYFPAVLYNLGEQRYAQNAIPSSRFFFNEYLKTKEPFVCKAYAAKRLADLALASNESKKEVVGKYLEVKENYPATDPGRFSHIRAMLFSFRDVPGAESDRRIRVIDEEIDLIENKGLREVAYLEKALALLDAGEESAIGSLVKVKQNSKIEISKGKVADFIRNRAMEILVAEVKEPIVKAKDASQFATVANGQLDLYEVILGSWLKGGSSEKRAKALVRSRVHQLVQTAIESDIPDTALALLERAKQLGLITPGDRDLRSKIAETFLNRLLQSENRKSLATWFLKHKDGIVPFTEPASQLIWLSAAVESDDEESIIQTASSIKQDRQPASVTGLSPLLRDYYRFNEGKALVVLKRWGEADERLSRLQTDKFRPKANELRFQIALEQKKYGRALEIGIPLFDAKGAADKPLVLETLKQVVYDGKLWSKAELLLKKAQSLNLNDEKISPFHYLAGRASWEEKRCRNSVQHYELALLKMPKAAESNEARYRLGKCLSQLGQGSQATKVWQELVNMQDPFWSKLAKNELNLSVEQ